MKRERAVSKIRIEAPANVDPMIIAQAVVGKHVLLKAEHVAPQRDPFVHWLALSQLYKEIDRVYGKRLDAMVSDIRAYIEQHILPGEKLTKAAAVVSPVHLDKIAQVVIDHHAEFIRDFGGSNTKAEVARLVKEKHLPEKSMEAIFDSYTYGLLVGRIEKLDTPARTKKLSHEAFTKRKKRTPFKLTETMKNAIDWMKASSAGYVRNHGHKIAHELVSVMGQVKNDLPSWRKLASEIGHRTKLWRSNLKRIAATEMQVAMQEGYATGIKEREKTDAKNILVVKIPNPDACDECVKLHLVNGPGSAPRVFRLSELEQNGTNHGRKKNDWKAVVGTVHPWCACQLQVVPAGWGYERKPPDGQGWDRFSRGAYRRKRKDGAMEFWRPRMVPESMRRGLSLSRDLMKATMTYGDSVPERGIIVRVGDPLTRKAIDEVLAETPPELFDKRVGVTMITTDIPRPGVALEDHDLAYWTGNEIRLSQTLPYTKVRKVIQHEMGHTLNVHLINKWGGEAPVIAWHKKVFEAGKEEGFVSEYAATLPIECAGEATRLYLYDRTRLMLNYPKQFALLHEAYRDVFRKKP